MKTKNTYINKAIRNYRNALSETEEFIDFLESFFNENENYLSGADIWGAMGIVAWPHKGLIKYIEDLEYKMDSIKKHEEEVGIING